jgi:tetratricopeptide (TPR) repeat protein
MIGWLYELQNRHQDALAHVRICLTGYRAAGHRDGEMFALNAVGWGQTLTGEHAEAVISCRQALALAEEAGDRSAQAMILDSVALAEHNLGHYAVAISTYRRSADLFRELANPRGEGSHSRPSGRLAAGGRRTGRRPGHLPTGVAPAQRAEPSRHRNRPSTVRRPPPGLWA